MKDKESVNLELVRSILRGLAKLRLDAKAWIDSEAEETEKETQVFKIGESLRPFYLAALAHPQLFDPPPLPSEILLKDTELFYRYIQKHGFFPSPYSQIPGASDQYTDFAAFVLSFSADVFDYWLRKPQGRRLATFARHAADRALRFLTDPQNRLDDTAGCRWAGTNKYSRTKKMTELYTDTCFTSLVVIAVNRITDHPLLSLPQTRQDEIRRLLREATRWIASRFDSEYITGNETKTNRALLHTTWGLRALAETYYLLDRTIKGLVPTIVQAYLRILGQTRLAREELFRQQEWLTVLSETVDEPLYYEDRSEFGGILCTLASLRKVPDLERLLEESSYLMTFERVFNSTLALRNPATGLWPREGPLLSLHSYLVDAFLMLEQRGKGLGQKIGVSGFMVRAAVKEVLADDAVIATLQQAVYDRLLRIVEGIEQERSLDKGLRELTADIDLAERSRPHDARQPTGKRRRKVHRPEGGG